MTFRKRVDRYLAGSVFGAVMMALSLPAIAQPNSSPVAAWHLSEGRLTCTYGFTDFVAAVDFVTQLVEPAEALAHHPDLVITYGQVSISLTTHDAGGVTELDYQLAEAISAIAAQQTPPLSCLPPTD
ncbi:MAG: 4a-hydroxytetrahydrobiopterin dehydratase [Cyanobacteria bacterium J06626_23]